MPDKHGSVSPPSAGESWRCRVRDTKMLLKRSATQVIKAAVASSAAGMLMGGGCGTEELQAVAIGIQAAAGQLDRGDRDDDMNFGEWLISEFDD